MGKDREMRSSFQQIENCSDEELARNELGDSSDLCEYSGLATKYDFVPDGQKHHCDAGSWKRSDGGGDVESGLFSSVLH